MRAGPFPCVWIEDVCVRRSAAGKGVIRGMMAICARRTSARADSDSGVVREFLRMFASEAKQRRNTNQDSSRTVLAMNLGTGHTTCKRAGARRALAMR